MYQEMVRLEQTWIRLSTGARVMAKGKQLGHVGGRITERARKQRELLAQGCLLL